MARGDYSVRVSETSRDEVGELARAFNRTAHDLATVDRQRRELVANVEPRAAHAADRAPGRAGEPRRRHRARRPARAPAGPRPGRAARGPGHRPARPGPRRRRQGAAVPRAGHRRTRCSPRPSRRRGSPAARWSTTSGSTRPTWSCGPTPPGCASWSPTSSTTRRGTARRRAGAGDREPGRGPPPHRGHRPGPGRGTGRPRARVRAVRHPQRDRGRWRHRAGPRDRAVGDRPARRKHRVRRSRRRRHRSPGPGRPPGRAARPSHPDRGEAHARTRPGSPVPDRRTPVLAGRRPARVVLAGPRRSWAGVRAPGRARGRAAGGDRAALPGRRHRNLPRPAGRRCRDHGGQRARRRPVHPGLRRDLRAARGRHDAARRRLDHRAEHRHRGGRHACAG